jgi:condensin complex subunit 2
LSRGGNQDCDVDGLNALGEKPKAKVGSKASSSRLNATDTIERNPSVLNSVKLENDYAFDPTFHKLSKAFDEGGAKGMLMYNMRLSKRDCSLAFVRTAAAKCAQSTNVKATLVDMRELEQRSGLTVEKVSRLNICAKLQEYRSILSGRINSKKNDSAVRSSSVLSAQSLSNLHRFESFPTCSLDGVIASPTTTRDSVDNSYESSTTHPSNSAITPGRPNHTHVPFASQAEDESATDPTSPIHYQAEDDGGVGDYWSPVYNVDEPAVRSPISGPAFDIPCMKLRWSLDGTNEQHGKENQRALQQSLEVLTADNEYAYFNLDAITTGGSNAWAGSQHWRYATRSRSQREEASNSNSDTVSQALLAETDNKESKKKITKKDVQSLVFSLDLVDEKKFLTSKSRTDTTIMTKAAQSNAEEDSAALLLPVDEKFQVKDLCRLSLWPNVVVAPTNINPLSLSTTNSSTGAGKIRAQILVDFMTGGETFWSTNAGMNGPLKEDSSNMVPVDIRFESAEFSEGAHAELDYGDVGGDYYGDDLPTSSTAIELASEVSLPVLSGLDINVNNLVQADRTVEKINIK